MSVTVALLYGTQGKREMKENDTASVILHTIKCKCRGYKDAYWKALKNGRRMLNG
jgi:hypothetical protein